MTLHFPLLTVTFLTVSPSTLLRISYFQRPYGTETPCLIVSALTVNPYGGSFGCALLMLSILLAELFVGFVLIMPFSVRLPLISIVLDLQ